MNLFSEIRALVLDALGAMVAAGDLPEGLSFDNVAVEPPRDAAHGDMATNAAMVLAKPARLKPRDIAEALAERLKADARISRAEVAGPGFLNLTLAPSIWADVVGKILNDTNYGRPPQVDRQRINVEFVSANPTGPLHVGHTRGAIFGDALAALLEYAGHEVTREYYINDGGAQVDVLARSAFERYREALGHTPEIAEGLYPGDYLVPVGQALADKFGDMWLDQPESVWLKEVRIFATEAMMDLIRADLAALGIKMDVFFSEKSLYGSGRIEAAIEDLRGKDLIYKGTLEPPKGKMPDDWEPREQTLFRSTAHGDDVDRPILKSDETWTYFAPDIAYHFDKVNRGFDQLIDVLGADHGGYVKRMKAAVSALTDGKVPLDIKLTQLVRLYKDGQPFKMSKRSGNFITARDVVDTVGADITRFVMLTRKNDAPLDFDFAKVLEQSRENPVFTCNMPMRGYVPCSGKPPIWGFPVRQARQTSKTRPKLRWRRSWRNGRVWWKLPPAPMSRTGLRFICTIWRRISTACGTVATTNPNCASCKRATPRQHRQKSPFRVPWPLYFPPVLVF